MATTTAEVHQRQDVVWLDDAAATDPALVGGKGANLARLVRSGFQVPGGFVLTAASYLAAAEEAGIRDDLRQLAALLGPDTEMANKAARIAVPPTLRDVVAEAYYALDPAGCAVAVRSSATAEDASDTSFAGMHATFTWVEGLDQLMARVRDCWLSLYGERVVAHRASRQLLDEPSIAVVVQRMVDADSAGVAFTADPTTGDTSAIVVEGAFGLGEAVVSGAVEPDTYVLDARMLHLRSAREAPTILAAMAMPSRMAKGSRSSSTRSP